MSQPQYKYQIRVNEPKPTEKEVQKYKSFNRVIYQYKRTQKRQPLHTALAGLNKLLPVVIVAIFIALVLFYYNRFANKEKKTPAPTEQAAPIMK